MANGQFSRIVKSVSIRAPRSRVWRALTDSREFSRWFGVEMTEQFQKGERVRMTCVDPSCKGYVFFVDVEEIVPEEKFSWRWRPGLQQPDGSFTDEGETHVEFRLEESEGGTRLTVTESGFDQVSLAARAKVFEQNEKGWEAQVRSVASYVGQTA